MTESIRSGSETYSQKELTAEMEAAFLYALAGCLYPPLASPVSRGMLPAIFQAGAATGVSHSIRS